MWFKANSVTGYANEICVLNGVWIGKLEYPKSGVVGFLRMPLVIILIVHRTSRSVLLYICPNKCKKKLTNPNPRCTALLFAPVPVHASHFSYLAFPHPSKSSHPTRAQ